MAEDTTTTGTGSDTEVMPTETAADGSVMVPAPATGRPHDHPGHATAPGGSAPPDSAPSGTPAYGSAPGAYGSAQAAYGSAPAAYGYPGSVHPTAAPSTPFALTSLILGVCSIFLGITVIAPVAGLVFGVLALRREPTGRTMALWGIVLNGSLLALYAAVVGVLLLVVLGMPLVFMS